MGHSPRSDETSLEFDESREHAWVEVIQKMDEVYSDLLEREVDLETKNAELEEANDFIDSILEAMSDVMIVCDRVGRIVKVNRALLKLTGFSEDSLVGRPLSIVLDQSFEKDFQSLIPPSRISSLEDVQSRLIDHTGAPCDPVSLNCTLHKNANNIMEGVVIVGRPIGELRQAYDALNKAHGELKATQGQLLQSEKMASIGRLVAGVAHELNNPMSFLYGNVHSMENYAAKMRTYIETLRDFLPREVRSELDEKLKIDKILKDLPSLLDGTREGAERVSDIVNNLRRLSFREGKTKDRVDVADVFKTAIQFVAKGGKGTAEIDHRLDDELWVSGSPNRLHQVAVNLVENALDAMGPSPQGDKLITITGFRNEDEIELHVRDHGPGIAEDKIHQIFDPFFTTKAVGEGTGLGLWICYEIIQDHAGTISVRNHEGGGCEFRIILPAFMSG